MESLPIINQSYDVYKTIVYINGKLSKRYLFSLGSSLEQSAIDFLEYLIMAKHAPKPMKAAYLIKASAQLEIIRFKLRLFLELELVNETKIFQAQSKLQNIGRMLGGWLNSTASS